jgi:folate-dependent phosphoribosylglycinamide formyltransferase PurN
MDLTKFHEPEDGPLHLAGFMSGSGTNLRKVLEHERSLVKSRGKSPFKVVVIFTDTYNSNAFQIGRDYDIPVVLRDINAFYASRKLPKKDLSIRKEFDQETVKAIAPYKIRVVVYAGYMSIASPVLVNAYLGINVHPADLSREENGKRKWTGAHAVLDAIMAKEKHIKASTHIVEQVVDGGRLLMLSSPLEIQYDKNFEYYSHDEIRKISQYYQDKLKKEGDWMIVPKTVEYLADGRYGYDCQGKIYFDGKLTPHGVQL